MTPRPGLIVLSHPTLRALLAVCLFTYVGQNMLNVSIAPLARALGLREWIVGLALSSAALTVTLLSQFWGRRSVAWGRRRVLLTALVLAVVAGSLFSTAVWLRAAGHISALATAMALIVARGPFFGGAVAAIPPTGQTLIAQVTVDEASRVKGMAAFSGAVQLSIVVGSVASSLLGLWSIYAPVHATPVFVVIALLIGWVWVPRDEHAPKAAVTGASKAQDERALPPRVSWADPRVVPWIGSAMGMFFSLGVVQILTGFIVQDRLALGSKDAVPVTAMMLLANAAGAMLTQLVAVPHLTWSPRRLVRVGLLVGLTALGVLTWAPSLVLLLPATFTVGMGAGLVGPGFNAGGSLAVKDHEQGGVSGVLNATGAVTWIFAPAASTALYGWQPRAPFLLALAGLGTSAAVAWLSPVLGRGRERRSQAG